ncbi:PaaI family thioesterase [Bacillaceae bacterium SIJ1]|uniref:PaaI family thioesterase n=1 Tax=Litoribacterium kuwaitense TaxID=1398745 RepID=UPI0013EB39E3|nr:PaaI family thioesterase [Litoribacterium kuwaitense]
MNLLTHLGIESLHVSKDKVILRMPVLPVVHQPMGFLHGGASVTLAETAASLGALEHCGEQQIPVGLEINANHLRPMSSGWLVATAQPIHSGRSTMVWDIRLTNQDTEKLICIARCTIAIKSVE